MKSMMAPWDSKMRWQFGGNLQRVRLICELNWRECPWAIINHIWSEIVTDVVDCVTNEGVLLRLIILILVCTILLHTIWTHTQWITDSIVSKDSLNQVDFKVQDLELRVNVLTYKMQYGAWPSTQQINDTNIKLKDDAKLSLSSPGNHRYSWLNRCLDSVHFKRHRISRSENLESLFRVPKTLIGTPQQIYCNRPSGTHELKLFNDALDTPKPFERRCLMEKRPRKNIGGINKNERCNLIKSIQNATTGTRIPKSILRKRGEKRRKSISENRLRKSKRAYLSLKSIHNNIFATTTAESSCEDSGNPLPNIPNVTSKLEMDSLPFTMKSFSIANSLASLKRISSTQETLSNVKERLENLHTILKTYGSCHDLESTRDGIENRLEETAVQHSSELFAQTEENGESSSRNITPEPNETENAHDQRGNLESECNGSDRNKQVGKEIDMGEDSGIKKTDNEMKFPMVIDTDEDLGSFSSPRDPSKGGSDSDKSTQSSDALMLHALLNQLDLTNLRRWNNKSPLETTADESECEVESVFPKMKNFYQSKLLDIISEEQSGSSGTEKMSKTFVQSKVQSTKNESIPDFAVGVQKEESNNTSACCEIAEQKLIEKDPEAELNHPICDGGISDRDAQMYEVTECTENYLTFNYDKDVPELPDISPQTKSETLLDAVQPVRPWEKLLEYSSEESIENSGLNSNSNHWNPDAEIISESNDIGELNHLSDIQNGEQLLDIANLSLRRRPGVFSMMSSADFPENDNPLIGNFDDDLIDLNYDDNDNIPKNTEINSNNGSDIVMSLMDVTDVLNNDDIDCLSDTVPLTDRTVISTKKIEDTINTCVTYDNVEENQQNYDICPETLCKNSNSRNLIELERIAYDELTQVENSWDSGWVSNNSFDKMSMNDAEANRGEKRKLRSLGRQSLLHIPSSPSSIYLTGQGSFSDMSIDTNQSMEFIEKIEMPDEVRNIGNVEDTQAYCDYEKKPIEKIVTSEKRRDNEDEEGTVISKDSALSETPQQSIIADDNVNTNGKVMNADISSWNSSTETSFYADAENRNLIHSSGVSLSYDSPELSQPIDDETINSSSPAERMANEVPAQSTKAVADKCMKKRTNTKNMKTTESNKKAKCLPTKTKSNLTITRELLLNSEVHKSDNRADEYSQRRSKSYIIPRKRDASLLQRESSKLHQHNSITKFDNPETRGMNGERISIHRLSDSKMKIERGISCSKSRESVAKSTSKSSIPVLKTRLDATKDPKSRSRSLQRGLPKKSMDIDRNSIKVEKKKIARTVCTDKCDNEIIDNVKDGHPVVVSEGQTVVYVNIVTDHDNCVTKFVDPKKFLEYVKDQDSYIQEVVNDNYSSDQDEQNKRKCVNSKYVTVVSSNGKNPTSLHHQREIEILAKPSVIDTSTSVSDIPTDNIEPKELTNAEYFALLKTLEQPINFYEYQKIHRACSELRSDAHE